MRPLSHVITVFTKQASQGVIKEKEEEDDIREEVKDIENNNLFCIE